MDIGANHGLCHGLLVYVPDRATFTPTHPYAPSITCLWAPICWMLKSPTQALSSHSPEPSSGNQLRRNLKVRPRIEHLLGGEWLGFVFSKKSGLF